MSSIISWTYQRISRKTSNAVPEEICIGIIGIIALVFACVKPVFFIWEIIRELFIGKSRIVRGRNVIEIHRNKPRFCARFPGSALKGFHGMIPGAILEQLLRQSVDEFVKVFIWKWLETKLEKSALENFQRFFCRNSWKPVVKWVEKFYGGNPGVVSGKMFKVIPMEITSFYLNTGFSMNGRILNRRYVYFSKKNGKSVRWPYFGPTL